MTDLCPTKPHLCSWLSTEKGEVIPNAPQEQSCRLEAVTCSSCCCSCCSSPGLSGTPSRWRRKRRSVCQHPPTPGDREQAELQRPPCQMGAANLHWCLCRFRGAGKAFTNHNLEQNNVLGGKFPSPSQLDFTQPKGIQNS